MAMSEDQQFGGATKPPADGTAAGTDYGFFAATPVAAPTQFGGPPGPAPAPGQLGAPPPQFGPPTQLGPPPPQFGPPPPQFGPPPPQFGPPPPQFGAPASFGAQPTYGPPPYPPAPRRGLPAWAIVAICVPAGLVVLGILAAIAIPVFLNHRNAPLMPDTLGGLSIATESTMTQTADEVRKEVTKQNPGRKVDVASYGTVQTGYLLMGLNVRVDSTREFRDLGATGAPVTIGEVQCATGTERISMCLRTGLRGSVEVMRFGTTDLSQLAAVTQEAWAEQPFAQ
jgi:hypothetical protein